MQARASPGAQMSKLDSSVSGRRQVSSKVKGTESLGTGGEASFVGGGWQLAAAGRHSPNSCETLASEVAATALSRRFAAAKARSRTAIRDPPVNLSSLSAGSSCIPSEADDDSEAEGSIASIPSSISRGWASASDVSATSPVPTEALEALEASFERTIHKERAKLDAARRAVSGDIATPASSGTTAGVDAVERRSSAQPPSRPDLETHDDAAVTPVERGEVSTPSHKGLASADTSADHETESAPPAPSADIDSDSADSSSYAAAGTLPMEELVVPGAAPVAAPVASPAPLSDAVNQKPRRTFTFGPGSLGMTFAEAAGRCTIITEVAAGSQAAKKGVVAGSKLISVAGYPMEGVGSDAAVARIKEEMQHAAQQPMSMEIESSAYDAPFQSLDVTPSGSNKKASLVARAFGFGSGTKSGSKR